MQHRPMAFAGLALVLCVVAAGGALGGFVEQLQFGQGATIPVAWGDAEGDGDPDVAVGRYGGGNFLFVNNGDGSFTQQNQFGAGWTFAVVWADSDNDGDQDLAVGRGSNQQNLLFVNQGDGTFAQQSQFGLLATVALAWADADLDGDLDMAVGNGILGASQQNYLYVNNGDGTFTGQPQFGTGQTCAVAWGDFDGDGDPDLAAGNGGFGWIGQNYLYVNNGDGTFTERVEFGAGDTAALAWGDCDGDGDLDLAVGNWNATQCALYVNNGDGTFTAEAQFGNRDTNTIAWGDADNDGDLDLAVGNGDFQSADQNYLYVNNGDGTFTEQAEFGQGSTDSVAWGDFDRDGDLDVAVGNEHSPGQNYLYVNQENDGEYLAVHLVGHRHDYGLGHSNRCGIGAKVALYEAGYVGQPDHLLGYREVEAHGGFSAQNAIDPHFGLSGTPAVDLRVIWPGSGGFHHVQDLIGVAAGQRILVEEPMSTTVRPPDGVAVMAALRVAPNPARGAVLFWSEPSTPAVSGFEIFDTAGRLVRRVAAGGDPAANGGPVAWDGRAEDGRPAPAGTYLVRSLGGPGGGHGRFVRLR